MDRLSEAELFVAIAEAGGFSGAARRLGRSQPVLSRRLAGLEARLGVRLLERTTRRVRLTEAGALFHQRCREALALLREAESAAAETGIAPRGRVRVSAPPTWARARLAPRLAEFAAGNPEVEIEMVLLERYVDLVAEGFDLVLRLGPVRDSSLASRTLSIERYVLCAAPSYLRRRGEPQSLDEIGAHNALVLASDRPRHRWPFRRGRRVIEVEARGTLRTNDAGLLREAAIAGLGLTVLPSYLVEQDLAAGALVELLPTCKLPSFAVVALYPSRRQLPRRVRVFLDFLGEGGRVGRR
jgi:DNA-binding transcriptional LysR family regulator